MKLFIITKKHLMMALSVIAVTAVIIVGSISIFANSNRLLPIYCVKTDKKQIAISFAAAWGNSKKVHKIRLL